MPNYKNPADLGGADPPEGPTREALGRSRGGLSTKIHLAADQRCRPLARITTGGQRHDSIAFDQVMAGIRVLRPSGRGRPRTRPDTVLADKAYSAGPIRDQLRRRRIHAVIPAKANEHLARTGEFDTAAYRQRNVVERCINKLKLFRALATRYDKRNYIYLGTIDVATIKIWLRDPVP
jgi:transposase